MAFRVYWDSPEPCPYLPGQVARMPLRMPTEELRPETFDQLLSEGDRRNGIMLYRTRCPACTACEPIRVPTDVFAPSKSQRRVLRRNEGEVRVEVGTPEVTARHVELYNRHKLERGLSRTQTPMDPTDYRMWLVNTCVDTREVRYFVGDRLVAVSILDFGRDSVSSVYHFFDPDESRRSLGVYSVLREIELTRHLGLHWYYLGFYVADCTHLAYKADYYPHQRRVNGHWHVFEAEGAAGVPVPSAVPAVLVKDLVGPRGQSA
jgi:arginyl-tRNA--protein-N-Asp/Glu arginylyltransferase